MSVYRFLLALLLIANGRDKDHEDLSTDNEMASEELELWVRHELWDDFDLESTVLQLPHHGSNGSGSLFYTGEHLKSVDAHVTSGKWWWGSLRLRSHKRD